MILLYYNFGKIKKQERNVIIMSIHNQSPRQISESFLLSGLLAVSGGFQDAYTYNIRDHVFSNAQTGNVVLMSQNFMSGNWLTGLSYMVPLFAFALGIMVTEQIEHHLKMMSRLHWRQLILLLEIVVLFAVGFIPSSFNMIATMLVSFSCSMQVQAFRKVNGFPYASTMCIGNLRSGTESLSVFLREKNKKALIKAMHYYGIILLFALGAGLGGICTLAIGITAIWISCALLLVGCIFMAKG